MTFSVVEFFPIIVFFISFYGLITSKNIIKSVIATGLMKVAVIMFFLDVGSVAEGQNEGRGLPPIIPPIGTDILPNLTADPLPQALMITAIIIGVMVMAVVLVTIISLYSQLRTTEWDEAEVLSDAITVSETLIIPSMLPDHKPCSWE